jgi:hypothetical protein
LKDWLWPTSELMKIAISLLIKTSRCSMKC